MNYRNLTIAIIVCTAIFNIKSGFALSISDASRQIEEIIRRITALETQLDNLYENSLQAGVTSMKELDESSNDPDRYKQGKKNVKPAVSLYLGKLQGSLLKKF